MSKDCSSSLAVTTLQAHVLAISLISGLIRFSIFFFFFFLVALEIGGLSMWRYKMSRMEVGSDLGGGIWKTNEKVLFLMRPQ